MDSHLSGADERVVIATLDGRIVADQRPMTRLSVQVTARRGGSSEIGFASISAREDIDWYSHERLEALARTAVDRAMLRFDARRAPAGDMPVILAAGSGGILLHEAIGHSFEADFILQQKSPYSGRLGTQVASSFVSVVDQATIPHERGALNYDDEGNVCGRTAMVTDGVLQSYLHDATTAQRAGAAITGSARRQSYRFAPMPRMSCTYMENGPHSRDEVIAAVDFGVIAESITTGNVELGAGDFMFNVRHGWLVEKGRITMPLKDLQVSGNGPQVLERVAMVADDLTFDAAGWTCGKNGQSIPVSQGTPTALISALAVTPRPF